MKRPALLIGLALTSLAVQGDEPVQEVTHADARIGPAFYEVAPSNVAASMRVAVERVCAKKSKEVAEWLCSGDPLHFLRGVTREGERTKAGFVCAGDAESKYYPSDIYDESGQCIAVWYDSEKKRHSVGVWD